MEISIHHLAEREIDKSAAYYSKSKPGLGKEFLDAVDLALDEILANPYIPAVSLDGDRRKIFRRFPFSIYYFVHHETIRVVSIAHHSRKPYYWNGRS